MGYRDMWPGSETSQVARDTAANAQGLKFGPLVNFEVSLAAGGAAGAPDDVDVFANGGAFGSGKAPVGFEILDVRADVDVAVPASTFTLRSAAAGGGTARSGALPSDAAGVVREPTGAAYQTAAARTVAPGEGLFVRRSDRSATGRLSIVGRMTYGG